MTMEKDELVKALSEALDLHFSDKEIHQSHHEFVEMLILERKKREEMWTRFRQSFIGGLALAVLGFLGWLGTLVLQWVQHGHH